MIAGAIILSFFLCCFLLVATTALTTLSAAEAIKTDARHSRPEMGSGSAFERAIGDTDGESEHPFLDIGAESATTAASCECIGTTAKILLRRQMVHPFIDLGANSASSGNFCGSSLTSGPDWALVVAMAAF